MSLALGRPAALLALLLLVPVAWLGLRALRLPPRRRRLATGLRLAILGLVVFGLARPRLMRPAGDRVAVLLLDASGSVPADEGARAMVFAGELAEASREGRRLALLVFGAEARLDRRARAGPLAPPRTTVDAGATDIAAALRLGAGLLPAGSSGRLILVSDGQANRGDLEREAALLAARGIPVDVLPLAAGVSGAEAWLAQLSAPAEARLGQAYTLELEIRATTAGPARLQLLADGEVIAQRQLALRPGSLRLRIEDRPKTAGAKRYLALLEPERDGRAENNSAAALTLVAGEPRLALLAGEPERALALRAALRANGLEVDLLAPSELPASPLALSAWDAFLLVDLPARALPPASQAALQRAVRDLGRGLLMVGGREGFGAGGWRGTPIEAALPVEMLVEADERRPDIALAFLIDRSSSMGEPISGASGAPSKLDLAKEAVLQAGALLRPADRLGLLAFDIAAHPTWPLQPAGDPSGFEAAVLGIQAQGGTSLTAGLGPARMALADTPSTRKHAILLSDGWTEAGGMAAARREAARLAAAGITLSVVGVGEASAPELAELATLGGGRYLEARDPAELPRIFVEETQLALGSYTVEQRFQPLPDAPSAILAGLDASNLPVLDGYDASRARPAALVALRSPLEDPLLAQWQYGLGRAVAWTSALDPTWAGAWLDWPDFARFAAQLVGWVLPPPETGGLEIGVTLDGRTARVAVRLTGEALAGPLAAAGTTAGGASAPETAGGEALAGQTLSEEALASEPLARGSVETVGLRLLGPDGKPLDLDLARVAADRFEAAIALPDAGAWLLRASARDAAGQVLAARTAGLVLPLAPEYAGLAEQPTDPRLYALAEATGGRRLDPGDAAAAFDPVPGALGAVELWPWLLTLAALLFPLDVALRRLGLGAAIAERRGERRRERRRGSMPGPGSGPGSSTDSRARRVSPDAAAASDLVAEQDDAALLEGLRSARERARRA